jgi:hypothetical protein
MASTFSKVKGLKRIIFNNVSHDLVWQCKKKMDDMLLVQAIYLVLSLISIMRFISTK